MKKITDSYVEQHIKSALTQLMPDRAEQIWEQPVEKASGDEWYLDGTGRRRTDRGKMIRWISSAAACLAVCLLSGYLMGSRTDATIYLDVNPSIELQINHKDKVLLAEANNRDGEVILEDMELKNTDLDVAVNAILGSMVKHGYLGEAQNMILLSVDCTNQKKAEKLRTQLTDEINICLDSLIGSGSILDQSVQVDEELETLAAQYGITPGKAALIRRLAAEHPGLDEAYLAGLPMNDLVHHLEQAGIDLRDFVHYTETVYYDRTAPEEEPTEASPEDAEDSPEDAEEIREDEDEEEDGEAAEPDREDGETDPETEPEDDEKGTDREDPPEAEKPEEDGERTDGEDSPEDDQPEKQDSGNDTEDAEPDEADGADEADGEEDPEDAEDQEDPEDESSED